MDIDSLISYFKFGFTGSTVDLIYLFLFARFAIFPFIKWLLSKIKEVLQ